MKDNSFEDMREILDPPVYMYQKSTIGFVCDKLTLHEDSNAWVRKRYTLTSGVSCTCLGFLKFKKCKHLAMLKDVWSGEGVPRDIAAEEAKRLVEQMGNLLPESAKNWVPDLDLMPESITVITFEMNIKEVPTGFYRIVSIKKIKGFGKLGIVLKISEFPNP